MGPPRAWISILLADPKPLFIEAIKAALNEQEDFRVVAEARDEPSLARSCGGQLGVGRRRLVVTLEGGQVVPFSSLRLEPNEGHIHLFLDGALVSMSTGLTADLLARPGTHRLVAEFVAVDHGSFDPPVTATTTFSVVP